MVIGRLGLALTCALLLGCAAQGTGPALITPYPAPAGGTSLALAVAPPLVLPSGAVEACDQALFGPIRVVLSGTVLSFVSVDTGMTVELIWPHGFAAWLINGKAEIVAPDGTVIGFSGDVLSDLGGGGGPGNASSVCGIGNRIYP